MRAIKSFRFKNFLVMALVLIFSFTLLGSAFVFISYRHTINSETKTMSTVADSTARMLSAYSEQWGLEGLETRAVLAWISHTTGYHILLCNDEGEIVSCSDDVIHCQHIGNVISDDFLNNMDDGEKYTGVSSLGGIYENRRYVIGMEMPVKNPRAQKGYIFISGRPAEMAEDWREFAGIFLLVALIALIFAFVISYITANTRAKPIREMAEAAHKFGHGDFSTRVNIDGRNDEIGELASSFNTMADSLERSESARRELIANVSHELKTPMTTITGFADGILDGTIPPEKQTEYISIISSETKRLNRLVRSMLDMSQVQSKDPMEMLRNSFDISEVVRISLLSLEQKITSKDLDVDAQLPEEEIITCGDKDSINQVVYNLIDNAVKFAYPGSVLKLALWKEEGKAYVSVGNDGDTIPKEELSLIFDRFHKSDRSRSMDRDGVGLGLYIVKTILDSHNEDIFVTSEDGHTEFVFTLTLKKD